MSPDNIISNWQLAKQEKTGEITAIYFSEELSDEQIEAQINKLKFPPLSKNN